jgi:uncharacterized membrane protein YsdA (DUF1294 family)
MSPYLSFGVLSFGLSFALAYFISRALSASDAFGVWLIAINLVAFLVYAYDKAIAGSGSMRVPELILLLLAMFGGWIGGGLAMIWRHHKTSKAGFLIGFVICAALSFGVRALYYRIFQG